MKTTKKLGRKSKPHVTADGKHIEGLRHRAHDRRWILSDGRTFTEPDEQKAIAKFFALTQPFVDPPSREDAPVGDLLRGFILIGGTLGGLSPEDRMWKWFGQQITERPKIVAQKTGHEEIAYLKKLKPLAPLSTFKELEQIWKDHFKKSTEQKRRVLHAWEDFKTTSKISSIDEITPELAIAYRDQVYDRNGSPKMQLNIFSRIRRMLTFAKSRAIPQLTEAIEALKLLVPNETTVSFDPRPIEVNDWKELLKAAQGDDKAMILLMLNGGFYVQEVIRLKWSEVENGVIITHRRKEGRVVRVSVLWSETLAALAQVKRRSEFIFVSYTGLPLGIKGADKRFRVLRDKAETKATVTSSQLRDGAATAMAQANVNEKLCNLLLGHRAGISDHYVKRNPQMVAPACLAIYDHYFPSKNQK